MHGKGGFNLLSLVYRPRLPHASGMRWFTELFRENNGALPRDPSLSAMFKGRDPSSLDAPLFQWSSSDVFTLKNALDSVCIFGEQGAAKTTAKKNTAGGRAGRSARARKARKTP